MPPVLDERRFVRRVGTVCAERTDDRALRAAVLAEIRQAVPFDAYAWLLTDPVTEVGSAPLADVPSSWLPELSRQIRLKYLTAVNRWTGLSGPVALLRRDTGDRRERSLVWREMLSDQDVGDAASLVFRDRFGCWGFLELWRTPADASFTDAEAESLSAVTEVICDALRACVARTFDAPVPATDRNGPILLVLSPELDVHSQTPEVADYLRLLVPPEAGRDPIPAAAYNVAAQLLAVEAGVDDHPPSARVHLAAGTWVTVRAARMGGAETSRDQDIAVTIERSSPSERLDLLARATGLSDRETEVLQHLAAGADTRLLAAQLFISAHTVQDHLKAIFAKTGARTRRALLARVLAG